MENMTRASYLMAIRKLIAAYKKKYDAFGKERKKTKRRKNGKWYYYINNYWYNFSNNCRNVLMNIYDLVILISLILTIIACIYIKPYK